MTHRQSALRRDWWDHAGPCEPRWGGSDFILNALGRNLFVLFQALSGFDEDHPHSTISNADPFQKHLHRHTQTEIIFNQLSGYPLAQASWHIKLTVTNIIKFYLQKSFQWTTTSFLHCTAPLCQVSWPLLSSKVFDTYLLTGSGWIGVVSWDHCVISAVQCGSPPFQGDLLHTINS